MTSSSYPHKAALDAKAPNTPDFQHGTASASFTRTFSLAEYAEALLGSADEASLQWLSKHLRGAAKPVLPGFKAAGRWRATQADIDAAIDLLRPQRVSIPAVPVATSMTRTSRRRLAS